MNKELKEALDLLEKEKGINKEDMLRTIEASLKKACENMYGTSDNVTFTIDRETYDFRLYLEKVVVDEVFDDTHEITLDAAKLVDPSCALDDVIEIDVKSKEFGRIAAKNAKNIITQAIREQERQNISDFYHEHDNTVMNAIVESRPDSNGRIRISLGKVEVSMKKEDLIPGEDLQPLQRTKVLLTCQSEGTKGYIRATVSRTKPQFVKRLFEMEVPEIQDNVVEIMSVAREAGSRTKIAVATYDPEVDPVGACIGVNGSRIGLVVDELNGEKIDVVRWDENPAFYVENALSPAKALAVAADSGMAVVIVPDNQLSLAIGMKGQNARLAAKLTGFKIDIKSESQADEMGLFDEDGIVDGEKLQALLAEKLQDKE